MKNYDLSTPVLVLFCGLGALSIVRTLGRVGVPVYCLDSDRRSPGMLSRFCRGRYIETFDSQSEDTYLARLLEIGRELGQGTILIPTSDDLSFFTSRHRIALKEFFRFQDNSPELIAQLISKRSMFELALSLDVPTPATYFPQNIEDAREVLDKISFPIMLKAIDGERLQKKAGKKMVIIDSADQLLEQYQALEDPDHPNLMIQELIPGADDQVYIFNGYFNRDSEALASFTGHKIRQYPVHTGCASLGECRWNEDVASLTSGFMKKIGYRGILDIGYRLDPRDGKYKVLDINPRVGQAFRMFVDDADMDVIRALYLDLTGQRFDKIAYKGVHRWMIEDYDIVSTFNYFREGSLTVREWLASFRGLREGAWFSWADPKPFMVMLVRLARRTVSRLLNGKPSVKEARP